MQDRQSAPSTPMVKRLLERLPETERGDDYQEDSQTASHRHGAIPSPRKKHREN